MPRSYPRADIEIMDKLNDRLRLERLALYPRRPVDWVEVINGILLGASIAVVVLLTVASLLA